GDIDAVRKAKELGASETMKRMSDNKDVVVTNQKENPAIAEEQRMRGMLQDQPHWAPFYIDLATILKKGSRFEEAEATLKRGIVQCSADKRLLLELAHLEKVILTKRLEEIKEVVREDTQWPYAKVASDSIEIEQRRRDSEVLRLRTEADPGNTEARLKLGLMLLDLGDVDNAISELQLSRKDPRLAWKALAALGKCFSAKNNIALARRNLEDALKALPKEEDEPRKEILFTLAQSHAATGDFDKAVEIANEIANIDFSYQGIGKLLDEWMAKARQA
ncbi:MAG: tetratricopeptide repeat protein, partial [Planctomycetia bacterium]